MLDNAIKYTEELKIKLIDTWYDEKYKYYYMGGGHKPYCPAENDWGAREFVSLDKNGKILGYISYTINRNVNSIYEFGAINFSDDKFIFGIDLFKVIDNIFCQFGHQKLEWDVVCGNPIEESYDEAVAKIGGRIVGIKKRAVKLADGKLYDKKMYEILQEDYLEYKKKHKKERN
jgi:hypothetical protein